MQKNYKAFVDRMITRYEGNYGWDRGDDGGPTKFGITCYDLAEYLGKNMNSMSAWAPTVRAMPLETAEAIYIKKYAAKDRFNQLESGTDCVMFDFGVNSGTMRPVWIAQHVLRLPTSSSFTDDLLHAINEEPAHHFIDQMCDARMAYLRGLKNWSTFRGGWTSRVADLRGYCHRIAEDAAPDPLPVAIMDRLAMVKQAQAGYNQLYNLIPLLDVDGYEGPKTKEQTRRFQTQQSLHVDGIIGHETIDKLAGMVVPTAVGLLGEVFTEERYTMTRAVDSIAEFMA